MSEFRWNSFARALGPAPLVPAIPAATGRYDFLSQSAFIIGFGSLFAPIWGGIFGILHRRFTRSTHAD